MNMELRSSDMSCCEMEAHPASARTMRCGRLGREASNNSMQRTALRAAAEPGR